MRVFINSLEKEIENRLKGIEKSNLNVLKNRWRHRSFWAMLFSG